MRARRAALFVVVASSALAGAPRSASADDTKQQCVDAYTQAQHLRRDGKLSEAHERLVTCSRDVCPPAIAPDCVKWLAEVEAAQPTIVIAAKDELGEETTQARLTIDGATVAERLDGRALPIDPGEHALRCEASGGRIWERKVVIHEGEKLRKIEIVLASASPATAPTPATSARAPATPEDAAPSKGWSPPIVSWVLGGVGLVAIGVGAFLDVSGKSKEHDLKTTCAPNCAQSDVDAMRSRVLAGDITLGVGIAAAAAAVTIAILSLPSNSAAPSATIGVAPVPGGGAAALHGRF
jgi:hypothetical protein